VKRSDILYMTWLGRR